MTVRLRCAARYASEVMDQFGSSVIILSSNDSYFDCSVRVVVSRLFFSWLLKYGDDIKILAPEGVIEQFRETCLQAASRYKE